MLRNYLTIALRNLLKRKTFSAINIMGLASGLAICMLIITLIRDQNSYDRFHAKGDRIYRIVSDRTSNNPSSFATTPLPLYGELAGRYPAIEQAVRIKAELSQDLQFGEETLPVRGLWTEPAFFDLFDFPFAYGDARGALREPFSAILSRELADKLGMAGRDPVGETVRLGDWGDFRITGVLAEPPGKTHIRFELLASLETVRSLEKEGKIQQSWLDAWDSTNDGFVYLLLRPGARPAELAPVFPAITKERYAGYDNFRLDFRLQPLAAITPSEFLENDMTFTIPKAALLFLTVLALIVLLTACFNYTNLTVAQALTRVREIGVRKVTGARRDQVFAQFLTESVVLALLALGVGYGLLEAGVIPLFKGLFFNRFFDIDLEVGYGLLGVFFLLSIGVGLLAGVLPAAYLSAFRPIRVLQPLSELKVFSRLGWRKLLISLQFIVSLVFITSVVVLFDQTEFMLNADYGFDKDNVINLSLQGHDHQQVREELQRNSSIRQISACSVLPASGSNQGTAVRLPEQEAPMPSHQIIIDPEFISNMKLALVAGREPEAGARDQILVNETLLRRLGYAGPAEALGQPIIIDAGFSDENKGSIVGVVKDFYYLGMERPIGNLILYQEPESLRYLNLRVQTADIAATLRFIEDTWKRLDPVHPVNYEFYDDRIGTTIGVYRDLMKILGFLAIVAIVITALGILGIATYSVRTRTKEIGIRKVLGASVEGIVWLLSRGLLAPVGLAIAVALPLSWFLTRLWLQEIAYHVPLTPLNMGLGAVALLVLGSLMVGSQAYRLAVRNPVETLRDE